MATVEEEAKNLPPRFQKLSEDQKLRFVRAARNSPDPANFYIKMKNPDLFNAWKKVNPPGAVKTTKTPKVPPKQRAKKRVANQLPGGKKATKAETPQELAIEKAKYDARMADIQSRQGLAGGFSFDFTDALGSQSYVNANPLFQQFVRLAALKGEFLAEMYVDPATIATGGGYTAVKLVGGTNKVLKGMNIPGKARDLYNKAGQYVDEAGNLIYPTIGPQLAVAGGPPIRQPRGSMFSVGGGGRKKPTRESFVKKLDETTIAESPLKADLDVPVKKRERKTAKITLPDQPKPKTPVKKQDVVGDPIDPRQAESRSAAWKRQKEEMDYAEGQRLLKEEADLVGKDLRPKRKQESPWDIEGATKETPITTTPKTIESAQEPLYALAAKSEEAIQAGKRLKELRKELKVEKKAQMYDNAAQIQKEIDALEGQIARGIVDSKKQRQLAKQMKADTKKRTAEFNAEKKKLTKEMKAAANRNDFEEASRLQQALQRLEKTGTTTKIDLKGRPAAQKTKADAPETPRAKADAPDPAAPELDPQAESYLRMAGADAPKTPKAKVEAEELADIMKRNKDFSGPDSNTVAEKIEKTNPGLFTKESLFGDTGLDVLTPEGKFKRSFKYGVPAATAAVGTSIGYGIHKAGEYQKNKKAAGDTGEEEEESMSVEEKMKQYQAEDSSKARKAAAEKRPEMYEKTKPAETEAPVKAKETATDYGLPIIEPRGIKYKMMRVDVADKLMTNQKLSQREQGFYNRHKKDIDKFIRAKK